jgi:uncharacterized RDD family membrane protein YckC
MKCPKCHYLSFDPEPRCRNCGYTLELGDADLAIAPSDVPVDPALADLTLHDPVPTVAPASAGASMPFVLDEASQDEASAPASPPRRRRSPAARGPFDAKDLALEAARDIDALSLVEEPSSPAATPAEPDEDWPKISAPAPADERPVAAPRPARPVQSPVTTELPLFVKAMPAQDVDDGDVEAHDRDALAVALSQSEATMRPTPPRIDGPARPRVAADVSPRKRGPLDRDLLEDLARLEDQERRKSAAPAGERVGVASRLGAALVDGALLGGLSAAIVWTTLRWCGLSFADARVLPITPTLGFLLVMGLSYLLLFTAAGGQTIGKMLCGIRVVDESDDVLPLQHAVYREVIALPSILALGLGFFPALVGDERALHDRLAHTKVVRA